MAEDKIQTVSPINYPTKESAELGRQLAEERGYVCTSVYEHKSKWGYEGRRVKIGFRV